MRVFYGLNQVDSILSSKVIILPNNRENYLEILHIYIYIYIYMCVCIIKCLSLSLYWTAHLVRCLSPISGTFGKLSEGAFVLK